LPTLGRSRPPRDHAIGIGLGEGQTAHRPGEPTSSPSHRLTRPAHGVHRVIFDKADRDVLFSIADLSTLLGEVRQTVSEWIDDALTCGACRGEVHELKFLRRDGRFMKRPYYSVDVVRIALLRAKSPHYHAFVGAVDIIGARMSAPRLSYKPVLAKI